ncbi:hypothetical protein AK812_SmicGene13862 [Symbiodinium microadriaticum]|uniref:Uncharacterized protein n=1 Tax=Symbiodinium microadriaticum TaxID=2951 RepID=A0A1Q9E726_SYMMI|nr:hypothetical protein AK812_SmicGene13862 [Symbiodinium microadriaticum]
MAQLEESMGASSVRADPKPDEPYNTNINEDASWYYQEDWSGYGGASASKSNKMQKKRGLPLESLKLGEEVTGWVKSLTSYGAFVDTGAEKELKHLCIDSIDLAPGPLLPRQASETGPFQLQDAWWPPGIPDSVLEAEFLARQRHLVAGENLGPTALNLRRKLRGRSSLEPGDEASGGSETRDAWWPPGIPDSVLEEYRGNVDTVPIKLNCQNRQSSWQDRGTWSQEQWTDLGESMSKSFGVVTVAVFRSLLSRSSNLFVIFVDLVLPGDAFDSLDDSEWLEQRLLDTNDELGMVWLPPGRHVLGADAARLLRPHLLESVTPHHKRFAKIEVAQEMACLFKHVAKTALKTNRPRQWRRLPREQLKQVASSFMESATTEPPLLVEELCTTRGYDVVRGRKALQQAVFRRMDVDQDEFLNGVELHPFAVHTGFEGDVDAWFEECGRCAFPNVAVGLDAFN